MLEILTTIICSTLCPYSNIGEDEEPQYNDPYNEFEQEQENDTQECKHSGRLGDREERREKKRSRNGLQ